MVEQVGQQVELGNDLVLGWSVIVGQRVLLRVGSVGRPSERHFSFSTPWQHWP